MVWWIASAPLWLVGGLLTAASFGCVWDKRDHPADRGGKFITGMSLATIFFAIAAKLVS